MRGVGVAEWVRATVAVLAALVAAAGIYALARTGYDNNRKDRERERTCIEHGGSVVAQDCIAPTGGPR